MCGSRLARFFLMTFFVAVGAGASGPDGGSAYAEALLRSAATFRLEGDRLTLRTGFQNTYTMKTDYGVLTVTSTDELRARIQEVKATRALEKLERSEEFKDAAKGAVTGMVEGGKALVTSPVDTTKSAVKGMGRWLGNVQVDIRCHREEVQYTENVIHYSSSNAG